MTNIRNIDYNRHTNFFSLVVKGLLKDLSDKSNIPHIIVNTGDDTMWLYERGYDASKEPVSVTNQEGIYHSIPYCTAELNGVAIQPDQLTSPYTRGLFQVEHNDTLRSISAEFRRMPVKIDINLTYISDSFTMMLDHIQFIISNLAYVNTFYISYLGQSIPVSYSIPDNLDNEYNIDIDGQFSDSKDRKSSMSIEVETAMPVYNMKTAMDDNKRILTSKVNLK